MWKILLLVWIVPAPFTAMNYRYPPTLVKASGVTFETYAECDKQRRDFEAAYHKSIDAQLEAAFRDGKHPVRHHARAVTQCVPPKHVVSGQPT